MAIKYFKDVLVYRLLQDVQLFQPGEEDELDVCLESKLSREPLSLEFGTFGFIEPCHEEGHYCERMSDGSLLITAQQWKKDLPASVVNREVMNRVLKIQKEELRKVYAKEKREIKTEVITSLLPRAWVKGKRVSALVKGDYIFVDTAAPKLAEALLCTIRECLGSLPIRPVTVKQSPIVSMTNFLRTNEVDDDFVLGENFQAKGATDEGSSLSGKSVDLSEDDIRELLASGRQVTQLQMGYLDEENNERVFFTLTEDLTIKGIQWPDCFDDRVLADTGEDVDAATVYRASMLLISDALGRLYDALLSSLGGEHLNEGDNADFDKRMEKIAKGIAKITKSFQLGDTNPKTDFALNGGKDTDPDECAANGGGCRFGPHGQDGEIQCEYCARTETDEEAALRRARDRTRSRVAALPGGPVMDEREIRTDKAASPGGKTLSETIRETIEEMDDLI